MFRKKTQGSDTSPVVTETKKVNVNDEVRAEKEAAQGKAKGLMSKGLDPDRLEVITRLTLIINGSEVKVESGLLTEITVADLISWAEENYCKSVGKTEPVDIVSLRDVDGKELEGKTPLGMCSYHDAVINAITSNALHNRHWDEGDVGGATMTEGEAFSAQKEALLKEYREYAVPPQPESEYRSVWVEGVDFTIPTFLRCCKVKDSDDEYKIVLGGHKVKYPIRRWIMDTHLFGPFKVYIFPIIPLYYLIRRAMGKDGPTDDGVSGSIDVDDEEFLSFIPDRFKLRSTAASIVKASFPIPHCTVFTMTDCCTLLAFTLALYAVVALYWFICWTYFDRLGVKALYIFAAAWLFIFCTLAFFLFWTYWFFYQREKDALREVREEEEHQQHEVEMAMLAQKEADEAAARKAEEDALLRD